MWAGSKYEKGKITEMEEGVGEEKRRGGEKKREEFWERLAMVQSAVRRIARRDGGRERKEGETFWRLHCGCSLDVPLTGTRLGDTRRQCSGFFICLAPPGFSWPEPGPGSETLWPTLWSQPVGYCK